MRVLGLLSFFAEKPEHLTEAVSSLGRAGCCHLVAVDGAYGLFPDGKASSGPESHDAIREACREAGMGLTLHVPPGLYAGNEVEKRSLMFTLAHEHAEPGVDWLWVHDADEVVEESTGLLEQLERTDLKVAALLHGERGVRPRSERRLFRAHPKGISVQKVHYFYVDGDGDVLWGPGQVDRVLLESVRVLHRPLDRDGARNKARNRYYEDRLISRAEPELVI